MPTYFCICNVQLSQNDCVKKQEIPALTDEERSGRKKKNVRIWVSMRTNVVGCVIDDSFMCFMGFKSMRKDCTTMIKASSCRKRESDG